MARCVALQWSPLFWCLSVLCQGILSLDHVPMVLWSTDRSLQDLESTLYEGHIVSMPELHLLLRRVIVSPVSSNLVLFLQDSLSVDDFTRYANSSGNETPFHNVQEFLKISPSSLVLPAVDCHAISHLSDYLQETLNSTVVNVDGPDIAQWMVNVPNRPSLFVINLQPIRRINELSTQEGLMENDRMIGRFIQTWQQEGVQSLAIYTAKRPSKVPMKSGVAWHTRRQLLSAEDQENNEYRPLNVTSEANGTDTPCILFYATNFSLIANGSELIDLTNLTFLHQNVDFSLSNCSDTNTILSLNYINPKNTSQHVIQSLKISFLMTNKFYEGSARNWFTLDFVHIQQDDRDVAIFNVTDISAPAEYSFHCQLVGTNALDGVTLIQASDEAANWEVLISEFQIQAFGVESNAFSYASDCTSFFTPGIWMGLVTSLVLLLILTYGIHMITNLTTNSRFDDPKGPALSVPQTE
uniref:V-type proton ATPase subunit S1-like n=1 Tax=Pogona vitticeps TaxID=103695 RepID=A0ABM5GG65_9SAUR